MSRLRLVRSVHAPIGRPKSRWGTVNIAAAPPSATAEPVSLNTMSGIANWVTDVPNAEIVSPVQNFQKSSLTAAPRSPFRKRDNSAGALVGGLAGCGRLLLVSAAPPATPAAPAAAGALPDGPFGR